MNERVKEIRQNLGLTQEEFAKKINISRSNLGGIETNRVNLSNRVIKDICKVFAINETWLRSGEGEMYLIVDDNQKFNEVIAEWLIDSDPLTKETLMTLATLSKEEFEIVSKMLKGLKNN